MTSILMESSGQVIRVVPKRHSAPTVDLADVEQLRCLFAHGHINALLGAGFSGKVLPTLGKREEWLTWCQQNRWDKPESRHKCEALLQLEYFDSVLSPMASVYPTDEMRRFVSLLRRMIETRGNVTIPRRAGLFTTNYDPLLELAMEAEGCPYNDGFEGRVDPAFSTRAFSRIQYSQSLSMEYSAPVPTINIIKLHGSVTWEMADDRNSILYHDYKKTIDVFREEHAALLSLNELDVLKLLIEKDLKDASSSVESLVKSTSFDADAFLEDYRRDFYIINPTKRKFEETVMGLTHYELLRLYANELDRNNVLLLCFGFSFEDEHILEITKRALDNTSLVLLVCCYSEDSIEGYVAKFGNRSNIWYLVPDGPDARIDLTTLCGVLELMR